MTDRLQAASGEADAGPVDPTVARPLVSRPRTIVIHASLVLFALAIVARAVQLQLVETTRWADAAETQQVREQDVIPPRGPILDAHGNVLVETRELMRIAFDPGRSSPSSGAAPSARIRR